MFGHMHVRNKSNGRLVIVVIFIMIWSWPTFQLLSLENTISQTADKKWSWWRHQMEKFSALRAICAGNSAVNGEFPAQRPVTRSFDVFFDLRLNKRLSKQSWGWWFETLSRPLWRHCNAMSHFSQCNGNIKHYCYCWLIQNSDNRLSTLLNTASDTFVFVWSLNTAFHTTATDPSFC